MAVYGVMYAVNENNCQRVWCYHLISQNGYMVTGIGIGTALGINDAVSLAFTNIIYKALLMMGISFVTHMTGGRKQSELGGLYRSMPWTFLLYCDRGLCEPVDCCFGCLRNKSGLVILMLFFGAYGTWLHPLKLIYMVFLGETTSVYFYWSRWEKWQDRKALHLFWGMMLNLLGFVIMCLPSGFLSFQASPVVLNPELGDWARAWAALNNPTWWPVNIHRIVGNIVLGGFVCGAYAGVAYLGAKTQEEREHYDWMGYTGNFIGVFGILPMPFAGYYLMREVYEYNQQMGITLMGGILSWLFILQAVLIGVLFVGANYYFWQGIAYRTHSAPKYKTAIVMMLVVLVGSFAVWLTPHSLVASVTEERAMGGGHIIPCWGFSG